MAQNSAKVKEKSRHGCLTAYLLVLIIGGLIAFGVYLLRGLAPGNDRPFWVIIVYLILTLLDIVFAIAIILWKKWGVWGLCADAITGLVINIIRGELFIVSLISLLITLGILFWVLHIGRDNKAWPQLE